jgi:hypothetical protein
LVDKCKVWVSLAVGLQKVSSKDNLRLRQAHLSRMIETTKDGNLDER